MKNSIYIPLLTSVTIEGAAARKRLQRIGYHWDDLKPLVSYDTTDAYARDWKMIQSWQEVSNLLSTGNLRSLDENGNPIRSKGAPKLLLTVGIGVADRRATGDHYSWPTVEAKVLRRMLQSVGGYVPSSPDRARPELIMKGLNKAIAFCDYFIGAAEERDGFAKAKLKSQAQKDAFVPEVAYVKSSISIQMLLLD